MSLELSCGMVLGPGSIQLGRRTAAPSNSGRGLFPLTVCEAVSSCRRQRRRHHEATLVGDAMHGLNWLQDATG